MIKKNIGRFLIGSVLMLLPMVAGLLLWNRLPEEMVTHWGVNSVPNGWSSKEMVVFGIPVMMLALHWVAMLITAADPKMKNQGEKPLKLIAWICPALTLAVCAVIYAQALEIKVDVDTAALLLMGVMFLFIGNYLPKCKQNHTLGIKLPWTLHSEANWNATHRFSGKVWVVGGVLLLVCVFLPKNALLAAMLVVLPVMVLLPVGYSYLHYKRHQQ